MKNWIIRSAAAVCALVLACGAVSCSKAAESSVSDANNLVGGGPQGDMAEEDMPYGATLTQLRHDYDEDALITIEFDHRFFTNEDGKFPEIYKATEYFDALNNSDGAAMEAAYYPGMFSEVCGKAGYTDTNEYMKWYHDTISGLISDYLYTNDGISTDGDFKINYLMVEGIDDETTDEKSFADMDAKLEAADSTALSKVTSRKRLAMTGMYSLDGEGSRQLNPAVGQSYIYLYIYTIDGKAYVV
jgi:hypothetical protein